MDEQKETVTSIDPKSGQSKEVNVVLDHARSGGLKYTIEDVENNNKKTDE